MYKYVTPKLKEECSTPLQLGVSFASGYIAGAIFLVSNPVDNLVSFLKNFKGAIATNTTIPEFLSRGLSTEEGESLLKNSVTLIVKAHNRFWEVLKASPENHPYNSCPCVVYMLATPCIIG